MSSEQQAKNGDTTELDITAPKNSCEIKRVATVAKEEKGSNEGSLISLNFLEMGVNSSTMLNTQPEDQEVVEESKEEKNEMNLRVQIYKPQTPVQVAVEEMKLEMKGPEVHRAMVEESKTDIMAPEMYVAIIEEPKIEVVAPTAYRAVIEEPKIGTLKTSDGDEIIIVSDDDCVSCKRNPDNGESPDDVDQNNNTTEQPTLKAVDSYCCARTRVRERERDRENETRQTQTPKGRAGTRQRARVAHSTSLGILVGTSSNNESSEQMTSKLKITTQPTSSFKQRQLELHRHRIAVEQKRLELLELKIARERDEMLRETILFEKELDLKTQRMRKLTEDRIDL